MTDSLARSLTTKFKRQAIAVLMAGVSFAALAGLAQATTVPVYTANLDTNPMWGGSPGSPTTLDQITQNWGAAVMNGLVVSNSSGLGLRDFYNPGSPGSFTPSVVTPANTFAFEYTFTVGSSANPQGSFVTSFGGLTDISLALYQGAPSLFSQTPNASTNPQGAGTAPLDVGILSTAGTTAGEYVLQLANLTAGNTYYLTVTGALAPGSHSGNFYGLAQVSTVPLPSALLMFGSVLAGMGGLFGRRRLGLTVRKLAHGASGVAIAGMAALGLILTTLFPGGAMAAQVPVPSTYTDISNPVAYPPPSGGTEYLPIAGLILGGPTSKVGQLAIPGGPIVSAPYMSGFVFDYQFDLTKPAFLQASISQLGTNMTSGTHFELFAGTPSSPSASPLAIATVSNSPTPGELVLSYAGASGKGMSAGDYFLAVTGSLAGGHNGSFSGTMELSAVPLPTALLLFGSAIGGLAVVERFGRNWKKQRA